MSFIKIKVHWDWNKYKRKKIKDLINKIKEYLKNFIIV